MPKSSQKIDGQYSLFELIATHQHSPDPGPGGLNIQHHFQGIITQCIKKCPLSRWQIAGKMSELLNQEITKYMLDTWTAESKEYHRFPAEYLPAFCAAVGSFEPLRLLAEKANVFVVPGPEALRAEIRRLEEEIKRLQKEKQKRQVFLREVEHDR
jgi:hypothetical protein